MTVSQVGSGRFFQHNFGKIGASEHQELCWKNKFSDQISYHLSPLHSINIDFLESEHCKNKGGNFTPKLVCLSRRI